MSDTEDEETACDCPCGKENDDAGLMIECSTCETNYHPQCCGLDGLTKSPLKHLKKKKWVCPRCFKFPENFPKTLQKEKTTSQITEQTVDQIIAIVNSTVEENLKTLLAPENLEKGDDNNEDFTRVTRRRQNSIQKVIREEKEEEILIEKKKKNLIIFNIPESSNEEKKEEMLEDFQKIQKVYTDKATLVKGDIAHITRLGAKDPQKTRPVLITLKEEDKRKELLTKNKNLKLLEDHISTNIYVSPDLTRKQREADKALREELKQLKKTNANLVIRNHKIVPFREAQDVPTWASLQDQL